MLTKRVSMVEGPLGPLKLHLVGKVQIWRFTTGTNVWNEAFFSKLLRLARMSRNVTKGGQHG